MDLVTILCIVGIVVVLLLLGAVAATRYKKCAPEEAMILTGKGGQKIVVGGGVFVMPVIQKMFTLGLGANTIQVDRKGIYTKNRVPITVNAVMTYKIKGEVDQIKLAAQAFHGKRPEEISGMIERIAEGAFRDICGKMTPEEINENRDKFQNEVTTSAQGHFDKIGIDLISFNVTHISDEIGYFTNLGAPASAEVDKEARVKKAEANKAAVIVEAEQKLAGQKRQAETDAEIAEAQKERDVKKAKYNAEVAIENAVATQAGPKQEAVSTQEVVEKQITLKDKEAERKEKELLSTVVKPAEADKKKAIITAEGDKQKAILEAEGERQKKILEAEGEKEALTLKGEGEGASSRAKGEGEAAAIKAKMLAEAEGTEKKALALQKYNDAGMNLQVTLELIHELPEIIKAAASPINAIDKLQIIDLGGGGGGNGAGGPIGKILDIPPQSIAKADVALKAILGTGLKETIELIRTGKISSEQVEKIVEGKAAEVVEKKIVPVKEKGK